MNLPLQERTKIDMQSQLCMELTHWGDFHGLPMVTKSLSGWSKKVVSHEVVRSVEISGALWKCWFHMAGGPWYSSIFKLNIDYSPGIQDELTSDSFILLKCVAGTLVRWFDVPWCNIAELAVAASSLTVAGAVPCNSFMCPVKFSSLRSWRIYCPLKKYSGSPRFLGRRWKLCSATLPWWTLLGGGWSWAWERGRRPYASGCPSMRPAKPAPSQRQIPRPATAIWDVWIDWFPSNIHGTAATETIIWSPRPGTSEMEQWNHSFASCGKNAPLRKDPPTQTFVLQLLWTFWEENLCPCEKGNLWRSLRWMPLIVTGWLLKSVLLYLTNVQPSIIMWLPVLLMRPRINMDNHCLLNLRFNVYVLHTGITTCCTYNMYIHIYCSILRILYTTLYFYMLCYRV